MLQEHCFGMAKALPLWDGSIALVLQINLF